MQNFTTTPIFIDASVFLAHLTDGKSAEGLAVKALFSRLETGEGKVVTSPLVIYEVVSALSFYHPKASIVPPLSLLLGLMRFPERRVCLTALDLWLSHPIEFADALMIADMRAHHVTSIFSSNKNLDDVRGVKRHELSRGEEEPSSST